MLGYVDDNNFTISATHTPGVQLVHMLGYVDDNNFTISATHTPGVQLVHLLVSWHDYVQ